MSTLDPERNRTDAKRVSTATLAFVGDAVYGLLVRERLSAVEAPVGKLHEASAGMVCSLAQSEAYDRLCGLLTDDELAVLKRGRNMNSNHVPKNADTLNYRRATGVEALFGYLYLSGENGRIRMLFDAIWDGADIPVKTGEQQ